MDSEEHLLDPSGMSSFLKSNKPKLPGQECLHPPVFPVSNVQNIPVDSRRVLPMQQALPYPSHQGLPVLLSSKNAMGQDDLYRMSIHASVIVSTTVSNPLSTRGGKSMGNSPYMDATTVY
jgi:hypothetical protein